MTKLNGSTQQKPRSAKAFIYRPKQHDAVEDKFVEDLRGLMWKRGAFGKATTWKQMAEKTTLAPATVQRFARGDTRRPTFRTIFLLLEASGYRLQLPKARRN